MDGSLGRPDESAQSFYWLLQILRARALWRLSPERRLQILGGVAPPGTERGQIEHSKALWSAIQQGTLRFRMLPGGGSHSAATVAVDAEGRVAALLHTNNTRRWGTTGLFVDGVSVPDSGGLLANQRAMRDVGPGGRLPNDGNPFVALRRSRFALAGSCCSNALHEKTVQMVLQVLDFDVDIDVANRGPCILTPTLRSSGYVHRVLEGFDAALLDEVRSRGEAIEVVSPAQAAAGGFDALWVGIARVPEQGTLRGTGIGVLG